MRGKKGNPKIDGGERERREIWLEDTGSGQPVGRCRPLTRWTSATETRRRKTRRGGSRRSRSRRRRRRRRREGSVKKLDDPMLSGACFLRARHFLNNNAAPASGRHSAGGVTTLNSFLFVFFLSKFSLPHSPSSFSYFFHFFHFGTRVYIFDCLFLPSTTGHVRIFSFFSLLAILFCHFQLDFTEFLHQLSVAFKHSLFHPFYPFSLLN